MGVQVTFDYNAFIASYPMFATLSQSQVNTALVISYQYLVNDGSGPVTSSLIQSTLQNLIVAHICQLMFGANGQPAGGAVGRVSSATEGSVSVTTDFPVNANNAWYMQTQFGAMFWAATAPYRTMRYVPGKSRRKLF